MEITWLVKADAITLGVEESDTKQACVCAENLN